MAVSKNATIDALHRIGILHVAGEVRRMHTCRTLQEYPVSTHVYGAQILAVELCKLNGIPAGNVLQALLYHDAPESQLGDIPAPTKRGFSPKMREELTDMEAAFILDNGVDIPQMTPVEHGILHVADVLDLAIFCIREHELGNRSPVLRRVFDNAVSYTDPYRDDVQGVRDFVTYIKAWWNHVK